MRNTKTEFVSCPSCGRTLFDLQETTANIQQKTGHLPGTPLSAFFLCILFFRRQAICLVNEWFLRA